MQSSYEPRRFFLVRLLPQTYPPTIATEAAEARRTTRTRNALEPRALLVAVVVSVTVAVVVTRVRVCVVVVVEAVLAAPTLWIMISDNASSSRSADVCPRMPG